MGNKYSVVKGFSAALPQHFVNNLQASNSAIIDYIEPDGVRLYTDLFILFFGSFCDPSYVFFLLNIGPTLFLIFFADARIFHTFAQVVTTQ